jgi:hypothetical protein
MKLPEDRKERIQVFVLSGLVAAILVFGVFQGLSMFSTRKKQAEEKIEELQARIEEASARIERMREDRAKNCDVLESIFALTDRHVLEPHLGGNYMLEAKSIINRNLNAAGIDRAESVRQKGTGQLKGTDGTFLSYQAGVSIQCGYYDLLKFIYHMKNNNPLVSIGRLRITPGKNEDRTVHSVEVEFQWPVWADKDSENNLREQLRNQRIEKKADNNEAEPAPDKDDEN